MNIDKVKDLAVILLTVSLAHKDLIVCQETACRSILLCTFTHNHVIKCLSSMVSPIVVTALLLMSTLHCY